jgi:predicted metal-dependent peptidase
MGEVRPFKDGKASAAEKDAKANEVDQWVNAAAMKSQNAGRYGAQEERLVKQMKAPEADWLSLLQFVVQDVCRDDYTWHRPNNRYVQAGVFLPSMNGHRRVDMMFFVDTSGSLSNDQLARIMANVREIISSFNVRVIMVYWDTEYRGTEVFYPDDILEPTWKLNYKGGGGTDFDDVVDWMVDSLDEYDFDPKAVVFFTDTETDRWPDEDPNLPWVWAQVPGYNNHFTSNYYKYMPEWGEHVRVPVFSGESS